jgi:hypothetical protein
MLNSELSNNGPRAVKEKQKVTLSQQPTVEAHKVDTLTLPYFPDNGG